MVCIDKVSSKMIGHVRCMDGSVELAFRGCEVENYELFAASCDMIPRLRAICSVDIAYLSMDERMIPGDWLICKLFNIIQYNPTK